MRCLSTKLDRGESSSSVKVMIFSEDVIGIGAWTIDAAGLVVAGGDPDDVEGSFDECTVGGCRVGDDRFSG